MFLGAVEIFGKLSRVSSLWIRSMSASILLCLIDRIRNRIMVWKSFRTDLLGHPAFLRLRKALILSIIRRMRYFLMRTNQGPTLNPKLYSIEKNRWIRNNAHGWPGGFELKTLWFYRRWVCHLLYFSLGLLVWWNWQTTENLYLKVQNICLTCSWGFLHACNLIKRLQMQMYWSKSYASELIFSITYERYVFGFSFFLLVYNYRTNI